MFHSQACAGVCFDAFDITVPGTKMPGRPHKIRLCHGTLPGIWKGLNNWPKIVG